MSKNHSKEEVCIITSLFFFCKTVNEKRDKRVPYNTKERR